MIAELFVGGAEYFLLQLPELFSSLVELGAEGVQLVGHLMLQSFHPQLQDPQIVFHLPLFYVSLG